jgi:hypothetical protein
VSAAILYLAIVAIWLCVLVPRWVRKTQSVAYETQSVPYDSAGAVAVDDELAATEAGADAPVTTTAAAVSGTLTGASRWLAGFRRPGRPSSAGTPVLPAPPRPVRARQPPSRARILQARRRMLTTLLALAIAAAVCTAARLTQWWICVPPAGMLGMYLLLLREAAVADAENEHMRQEAIRARIATVQRAREAWAAREPEPTAEIIDISARVRDQLYDQYADATVRAVGD